MIHILSPHVKNDLGQRWIAIQERFIKEKTKNVEYEYRPFYISDKVKHIKALDMILHYISSIKEKDMIIIMDSDAFPIDENWVDKTTSYLKENEFVAVQRLENPNFYREIAHPCFCAWYNKTTIQFGIVASNPYILNYKQRTWKKLHRTNKKNLHRQLYAIYDDMIFHAGAGSRNVAVDHFFHNGLIHYPCFFENPERFIEELR